MAKYTIEEIKKKTLKPMNGFFEVMVTDRLSPYLVWIFANFTKITPNQISALGGLFVFICGYLFWKGMFGLGALSFFLAFFLDAIDGKVARITNNMKKIGIIYEGVFDLLRVFVPLLGITYGYYNLTNDFSIFFWSLVSLFSNYFFMFFGLFTIFKIRLAEENLNIEVICGKTNNTDIAREGTILKIRQWLNKRRLELQYITSEQEWMFFIIFPLLSLYYGAIFIKYGLIIGAISMLLWISFRYFIFVRRNRNVRYRRIKF